MAIEGSPKYSLRNRRLPAGRIVTLLICCVLVFQELHPNYYTFRKNSSEPLEDNCSEAEHLVNGTEFSAVWPNFSIDMWIGNQSSANRTLIQSPWRLGVNTTTADIREAIHSPPLYQSENRPRGLRIAMIGDSLMRYQFLMLVHYLHTGHWIHNSMQPNLLREGSFRDWAHFYGGLTKYFGEDYLLCDCFRQSKKPKIRNPTMVENQFYLDSGCLDNSVAMLWKAGDLGFRGHLTADNINKSFLVDGNRTKFEVPLRKKRRGNFSWKYEEYDPFLREFVARLEPRPRVVILNEGLWTVDNLSNETVVRRIQNTIRELGMISIYKTTTKMNRPGDPSEGPGLLPHDEMCCKIFDHCLRMDWTTYVDPDDYSDAVHFGAHPNVRFNEQFFELLKSIGEITFKSSPGGSRSHLLSN